MSVRLNLLAGLVNSIWSALVGLSVVPLYVRYLGIEAYGLIGFFVTMQAVLQLFDMGLAPTLNREVARHSAAGSLKDAGKLLHTLAVLYWFMALVLAFLVMAFAPLIAGYWIQPKNISHKTVQHAVMLMGMVFACHWPVALYQGALIGAQRLYVSSCISMLMSSVGNFGAVAMLALVSPTIEVYFLWHAGVGLIYAAAMRWGAWRAVGHSDDICFDVEQLKLIWRFSAGMSGVAVSGLFLTHLDKVLLSKILSLEDFGRYTLAGVVASGLYMIVVPTFNVIYPRLSALVITEDSEKLVTVYRTGTRLLSAVIFPTATAVAFFSKQILMLWTQNPSVASISAPILSLFLIGTTLHSVMHFPYALQLAFGITRLPLMINMVLIAVMIPVTIVLSLNFGIHGGATAWALTNVVYLLLGTWLTHRYLLIGYGLRWLLCDVGIPLCLSVLIIFGLGRTVNSLGYSPLIEVILGAGLALAAFVIIVLVSSCLRGVFKFNNIDELHEDFR